MAKENILSDLQRLTIAAATQISSPADALKQARALEQALADERQKEKWAGVTRPGNFPATLDDFLKLIVRAKTPADAQKRLRDFYRAEHAKFLSKGRDKNLPIDEQLKLLSDAVAKPTKTGRLKAIKPFSMSAKAVERYAVNQIKGWREGGFKSETHWLGLAKRYQAWWNNQKSAQAKRAASIRKRKGRKKSLDKE